MEAHEVLTDENRDFLRQSLDLAIEKIEKYTTLSEDTPAYFAAMLLHPGIKLLATFKRTMASVLPSHCSLRRNTPRQRSQTTTMTAIMMRRTLATAVRSFMRP